MQNIMLDLETLDTSTSSVVVSVGAVAFDIHTDALGETFYAELTEDIHTQQKQGRTISGDTVRWWMQQSGDAKNVFSDQPPGANSSRMTTMAALVRFENFVNRNGGKEAQLWGNGVDFDNAILNSLYKSFNMDSPWHYGNNRCFRTMKTVWKGAPEVASRLGVRHNAIDDAISQAVRLQEIFKWLKQH